MAIGIDLGFVVLELAKITANQRTMKSIAHSLNVAIVATLVGIGCIERVRVHGRSNRLDGLSRLCDGSRNPCHDLRLGEERHSHVDQSLSIGEVTPPRLSLLRPTHETIGG